MTVPRDNSKACNSYNVTWATWELNIEGKLDEEAEYSKIYKGLVPSITPTKRIPFQNG